MIYTGEWTENISEILLVKHAKPNQPAYFVRYYRVFVVTVIVITEFDCKLINKCLSFSFYG
jgi:hypothetical protein